MARLRWRDRNRGPATEGADGDGAAADGWNVVAAAVLDAAEAALGYRPALADGTPEPLPVGAGPGAYRLRLDTDDGHWGGPLLVRRADAAMLGHEIGWMWRVAAAGYPVPDVVADLAGDGLLVMRDPGGANLADTMVDNIMALPQFLAAFGRLHARLHGLDPRLVTTGGPWPNGDDAGAGGDPLDLLAARVEASEPVRAAVGAELAWLHTHRPPSAREVICHGELNPMHVYVADGDVSTAVVVNWTRARMGEPAYDVAATVTAFWSLPFFVPSTVQRTVLKAARDSLISAYQGAYIEAASQTIDDESLDYWRAYHLCWLATDLARCVHYGPTDQWDTTTNAAQPSRSLAETRREVRSVTATMGG